jgi:hypothetical protein
MNPSSARPHLLKGMLAAALLILASLMSATPGEAASLPNVSITLTPSSIAVGGTLQSGAVDVISTASGGHEPSPALFLLKPGVGPSELYAALDSNKVSEDPNVASRYGAIVFDGAAAPGRQSEAQTVLQPGEYVAINAEGEKSSAWPRTSFTVTSAAAPATLPPAAATVRSIEFAFRGPSTLKDGELVRFENEGWLVHMDLAFPVTSRATAEQTVKALLAGNAKKLQKLVAGEPVNFAGPLSSGAYQQETISAKPGWYVQACFMDTQDGRDHTRLGMERIIKVVK